MTTNPKPSPSKRDDSGYPNPFLGKDINEAEVLADDLLDALVKTCQRRPALPHEREEGILFFLTGKGTQRYEAGYEALKRQWADAGIEEDFPEGPIRDLF